ncbi:metal-binding protein [Allostella vacuolata]|nr:metal-binding protein [Stella vacuolata]
MIRRRTLLAAGAALLCTVAARVAIADGPAIQVHKDPSCGCCDGWVQHLRLAGFRVAVAEARDIGAVKYRLGVPEELTSCHTATIGGYTIEGHVPAHAIRRLLAERPAVIGLAVPGMPAGSPGMEGGTPETYDVVAFGPGTRSTFGWYREAQPA